MNLRLLGEDRLLEILLAGLRINRRDVVVAAGDDCAVVRPPRSADLLVLKTDCIVERVHFETSTDPVRVGWKAMMRPLSDFAAIAALPRFALITLIVPGARSMSWVRNLYRGFHKAADRFHVSIVGGETSDTPGPAAISVSVVGFVEKNRYVGRDGGRPNDDLFVTGRLGGSIGGKHLFFMPRIDEARWLTQHFSVHAMMDLSDGLGTDLPRLAKASNAGFEIDKDALPLTRGATINNAIGDGEDYELLFAISRRQREHLQRAWRRKFPKLTLTRIGSLTRRSKTQGQKLGRGYVHFQKRG